MHIESKNIWKDTSWGECKACPPCQYSLRSARSGTQAPCEVVFKLSIFQKDLMQPLVPGAWCLCRLNASRVLNLQGHWHWKLPPASGSPPWAWSPTSGSSPWTWSPTASSLTLSPLPRSCKMVKLYAPLYSWVVNCAILPCPTPHYSPLAPCSCGVCLPQDPRGFHQR